jgi:hypothetical protein
VAESAYPFPQTPATVSRWARMARLFGPSSVLGNKDSNPYGLTVNGLTATVGRGTSGRAEAFVRGFMHTLDAADWSQAVPANTDPNPRIDRIVARLSLTTETVTLARLPGTPAATPAVPPLTQTDTVWDLPLWRFTVPGNSGAPLASLVDDRYFVDVDTGWQGASAIGGDVTASWIARTGTVANAWSSVAWSPSLRLFVVIASAGSATTQVQTSPDGITWTARTIPAAAVQPWSAVCWSPERGLFVAVAANGATNNIMTSPDGITWTQRTSPVAYPLNDVTWAPTLGLFVAVANTGGTGVNLGRVITSPDGITWTARTLGTTAVGSQYNAQAVAWSPELGRLVAAFGNDATSTAQFWYSADGITWTNSPVVPTIRAWRRIVWSPERALFVAVAADAGGYVMTSPDGITWTDRGFVTAAGVAFSAVAWSRELGLFVAVASTSSSAASAPPYPRTYVSPDGVTWSPRPDARNGPAWRGVVWSRELTRFVVVGDAGALATSFA